MADILHDFVILVPPGRVFEAVTTPEELDEGWTKRSSGEPRTGTEYELWFGPEWDWRGRVTRCEPGVVLELELSRADADWAGTVVGFQMEEWEEGTKVRFYHTGWPSANAHFRSSSYCWAMYLRVLKRFLEHGERGPYEDRTGI